MKQKLNKDGTPKKKTGPAPLGGKLKGRATAVCSIEEQSAYADAARAEDLTVAKWLRKVATAALSAEVQERLNQK